VHEAEAREVGGALAIDVRRDRHVVAPENDLLSLRDPFFEEPRRDRALVDIEERYVVIGDLVKEDDELDEVGVRLLPERLLASAKEIVEEGRDVVCESIRVKVTVERVVAVVGIETDFDVILGPPVTRKDVFYLSQKSPFTSNTSPPIRFALSAAL